MADIELVIKIPEEDYKFLREAEGCRFSKTIIDGVINGTPLPKGHGDLIDRRELIKNGVSRGFCDWYDEIKYAETIIEADDKYRLENENEKEPDTEPDLEV